MRALLFAPGNQARKLSRIAEFQPDVIVLDLEDAVPAHEKQIARSLVRDRLPSFDGPSALVVRVNAQATGLMEDDVRALCSANLDAIMVPKLERRQTLDELSELLDSVEQERGLRPGAIRIIGILESAAGISRSEEIALGGGGRLVAVVFGSVDFARDVGVDSAGGGAELLYARSRVVVAARAASLPAPLDGPYLQLQDQDGLLEDSLRSRSLGFQGRVVIYPPHVAVVQRAYTASPEELERARQVVEAYERSREEGRGAIQLDGLFVDYPVYVRAKQQLRTHDVQRQRTARID